MAEVGALLRKLKRAGVASLRWLPPVALAVALLDSGDYSSLHACQAPSWQQPRLLADIGTEDLGFPWYYFALYPPFGRIGDRLLFLNDDGIHGSEPWITNGSSEGTQLLRDVCAGDCSAQWGDSSFAEVGGLTLFAAKTEEHGTELWRTDGTKAGTWLVKDIRPGPGSGSPWWMIALGKVILFTAYDGIHGRELWRTDGTFEGTTMIADLVPGIDSSSPELYGEVGGWILFAGPAQGSGSSLWRTDGTAAGTVRLSDLNPDAECVVGGYQPGPWRYRGPQVIDDRLFFTCSDHRGSEPWISDGTPEGTRIIKDLSPEGASSQARGFTLFGGAVFFVAPGLHELWRTDGTEGNTEVASEVENWEYPEIVGSVGDYLLLIAWTDELGYELWRSDGSPGSEELLKDINAGEGVGLAASAPDCAVNLGEYLVFPANDGIHGFELWRSDGTEEGTLLVKDVYEGDEWGWMCGTWGLGSPPEILGGAALSFARDEESGWSLWKTDGTTEGTVLVKDLDQQASAIQDCWGRRCTRIEAAEGQAFFGAVRLEVGSQVWVSDGTAAGTHMTRQLPEDLYATFWDESELAASDELAFFTTWISGSGEGEIWLSDGTEVGTSALSSIVPGSFQRANSLTPFRGLVCFVAAGGLICSDGTAPGTRVWEEPQVAQEPWTRIVVAGDALYFAAEDAAHGIELWRLGDLDAGPELVADIEAGPESSVPQYFASFPGRGGPGWAPVVAFTAETSDAGRELWASDGTSAGTRMVIDLVPGPASSIDDSSVEDRSAKSFYHIETAGGLIFFPADDGVHGRELWASDGTAAGTVFLGDLFPGPLSSHPGWLTSVGNSLYFSASAPGVGRELWETQGVPGRTRLVGDIAVGQASSMPQYLIAVDQSLYFRATSEESGSELWRVSPTALGPVQVFDLNHGPSASSPGFMTRVGNELWMMANDGVHGFEVWTLPVVAPLFADGFESGSTDAWTGICCP